MALGGEVNCCSQGMLGKSYQGFTFACDVSGCHLGPALTGGASGSPRSLQAVWSHKVVAEVAISQNSLASLSTQEAIKSLTLPACLTHGLNGLQY